MRVTRDVTFLCLLAILTCPLPGLHPTGTGSEYGEEGGREKGLDY